MRSFRASHFYFYFIITQPLPRLLLLICFNFQIITYTKIEIK
nr:MAG TPA: hypothetical protein [Caudoviricetes sp.]